MVSKVSYLANSEFGVRFLGLSGHFITVLPFLKKGDRSISVLYKFLQFIHSMGCPDLSLQEDMSQEIIVAV